VFLSPEDEKKFKYLPGQFAELSIPGKGEIPSHCLFTYGEGFISFTVNEVGLVSTYLHMMKEGYVMGVRGRSGTGIRGKRWRKERRHRRGGFALRPEVEHCVHVAPGNRGSFKDITVVYGARTPGMLLYKDELAAGRGAMISTCISRWTARTIRSGSTTRGSCRPLQTEDNQCR